VVIRLAISNLKLPVVLNIHVAADIIEISSMYVYTENVAEERHGGGSSKERSCGKLWKEAVHGAVRMNRTAKQRSETSHAVRKTKFKL
jgi:hypothetical protein